MKIAYVGKFQKLQDEEYIARSFEELGHQVVRLEQKLATRYLFKKVLEEKPSLVLFSKVDTIEAPSVLIKTLREHGIKTASWLFDLYWDYPREEVMDGKVYFMTDYVFTTDGGHDERWEGKGINHNTIRQGIYKPECYLEEITNPTGIVFVGCENPFFQERTKTIIRLKREYPDVQWLGRSNTNEIRGTDLNKLYARTKIVIGDSVYSPHYWSNRVVETLGRGGFLIHRDVPGIKEVYPDIVTYDGTYEDLKEKIDYFLSNEKERLDIVKKNFELVRNNYTCEKMCELLLSKI